jgi:hypothetical protein
MINETFVKSATGQTALSVTESPERFALMVEHGFFDLETQENWWRLRQIILQHVERMTDHPKLPRGTEQRT